EEDREHGDEQARRPAAEADHDRLDYDRTNINTSQVATCCELQLATCVRRRGGAVRPPPRDDSVLAPATAASALHRSARSRPRPARSATSSHRCCCWRPPDA